MAQQRQRWCISYRTPVSVACHCWFVLCLNSLSLGGSYQRTSWHPSRAPSVHSFCLVPLVTPSTNAIMFVLHYFFMMNLCWRVLRIAFSFPCQKPAESTKQTGKHKSSTSSGFIPTKCLERWYVSSSFLWHGVTLNGPWLPLFVLLFPLCFFFNTGFRDSWASWIKSKYCLKKYINGYSFFFFSLLAFHCQWKDGEKIVEFS